MLIKLRKLIIGVSLLTVCAPALYAQTRLAPPQPLIIDAQGNVTNVDGSPFDPSYNPTAQQVQANTQPNNRGNQTAQQDPRASVVELPPIDIKKESFNGAMESIMPMTPKEIEQMKKHLEETRKASRTPFINSKPVTGSLIVDLSPGAAPPGIRIAVHHGAVLNFMDSNGQPWPVVHTTNFNQKDFVVDSPFAGSSTVTISNLGYYGTGNVAVFLKDLPTPVTVGLYGNQTETDYRVDLRLPKRIPGSVDVIPASGNGRAMMDSRIIQLVDGIPPDGAIPVRTSSEYVRAYYFEDQLLIRTQLTLLSAFAQKAPGQDGTNVYAMAVTPLLTFSNNGVRERVSIDLSGIK